jgi:3-deoxy-D-manno-octulosonic-acid transferase
MRALYSLLIAMALPLALVLLWRGGARDRRWRERFGRVTPLAEGVEVWVHAASFGEVQAATPLIDALLERFGDGRVGVTTVTGTGSALVRSRWPSRVHHAYLPFDLAPGVATFLDRWRPRRAVIMESELWPNLFSALRRRRVPLLIANARMSPRSLRRYARLGALVRDTIACVDIVAAQALHDADSYRALGARRVEVTGNLKFDRAVPEAQLQQGRSLRTALGAGRPVWIAASTHDGEELAALQAHREVLAVLPDAVLIVVPRHPQRFDAVWERLRASGLRVARRSVGVIATDTQLLLGDSIGEMFCYLAAADLAFVGGSLVPIGGHNVLEPAALGLPVLFGPQMHSQRPARELLLGADAAIEVADAPALAEAVRKLLEQPERAVAMGERGRSALAAHTGATRRVLGLLDALEA